MPLSDRDVDGRGGVCFNFVVSLIDVTDNRAR